MKFYKNNHPLYPIFPMNCKYEMETLCLTNTNSQLALSSSLVQSSGSRCYRAPIVQEVGNLPSVARLRASNEVRYVVAVASPRAPSLVCADSAAAAAPTTTE